MPLCLVGSRAEAHWICIRNEFLLVGRGASGSSVMRTGRHLTFCVAGYGAVSIQHRSRTTEEREIENLKKMCQREWVREVRKTIGRNGGGLGREEV